VPKVKLKNCPDRVTEVTAGEMTDLNRLGLVLEEVTDEEPAQQAQTKTEAPRAKALPAPNDADKNK